VIATTTKQSKNNPKSASNLNFSSLLVNFKIDAHDGNIGVRICLTHPERQCDKADLAPEHFNNKNDILKVYKNIGFDIPYNTVNIASNE
jgi:hypothetical protein